MTYLYRLAAKCILMSLVTPALLIGANFALAETPAVFILTTSEWNVPRTTETILAMPALQKTIQAYNQNPGSIIQIHYPGGDEGTLWASELRSWLVALGVASRHIELLPGSRKAGQLELQVMPTKSNSTIIPGGKPSS